MRQLTPLDIARFWSKVHVLPGDDACWPWEGTRRNDYGSVKIDGKLYATHRIAFFLIHGTLPPAVRHTCDNPPCANPLHLKAGTQVDNIRDMDERGRRRTAGRPGEAHHENKLTDAAVRTIRAEASKRIPQRLIANKHGITQGVVSKIVNWKSWGHVQ